MHASSSSYDMHVSSSYTTLTHLDEVLLLRPVRLRLDLALGLKLLDGIPMLPPHLVSVVE
jgi:hypothetical protein